MKTTTLSQRHLTGTWMILGSLAFDLVLVSKNGEVSQGKEEVTKVDAKE